MATLTLSFAEIEIDGEKGTHIGWKVEKGKNQTMNELAELVKDLVYRQLETALNQQEKQNDIH